MKSINGVSNFLQLVVRHPRDPSYKFEWGNLYMQTGDYMKAKMCFHDAVAVQQSHQPRSQRGRHGFILNAVIQMCVLKRGPLTQNLFVYVI